MTAESERSGPDNAAPTRISWGRAVLRVTILAVAFVALVGFAMVLAELTLTPSPASAEIAGSNLRPGHSLRQYAEDYTFLAACKQMGGNLLMGAPFGLILPVLVPRRMRMLRVVLLTGVVMVLVELAQGSIIEGRAFDVDDVILNTGGALIAYLWLGRRIGRRFHALGVPVPPAAAPAPEDTGGTAVDGEDGRRKQAGRVRWMGSPARPAALKQRLTASRRTARGAAPRPAAEQAAPVATGSATKPPVTKPVATKADRTGAAGEPSWGERISRLTKARR